MSIAKDIVVGKHLYSVLVKLQSQRGILYTYIKSIIFSKKLHQSKKKANKSPVRKEWQVKGHLETKQTTY